MNPKLRKLLHLETTGRAYGFLRTDRPLSRLQRVLGRMKSDPEQGIPKDGLFDISPLPASEELRTIWKNVNGMPMDRHVADLLLSPEMFLDVLQLREITVKMGERGSNCRIFAGLPGESHERTALLLLKVFVAYSATDISIWNGKDLPLDCDIFCENKNGSYIPLMHEKNR